MAKVTFDGPNKLIILNIGTSTIDVKIDLYSGWKNWVISGGGSQYAAAFRTVGGDSLGDNQYIPAYYFLINDWRIYIENLIVTFSDNVYSDDYVNPFILIDSEIYFEPFITEMSQLTGITAGIVVINNNVTGLTNVVVPYLTGITNEISTINNNITGITSTILPYITGITNEISTINNNVTGITSTIIPYLTGITTSLTAITYDVTHILGLVQHNFRFSDQIYNSSGNLTSGYISIYASAQDCEDGMNPISIYIISAEYDSNDRLIDYKVKLV